MTSALQFCGRNSELETLKDRWRLACDVEHPSPQIVVIKAERGVGKTRLALEFYKWLCGDPASGASGHYWHGAPEMVDRNLEVNPDPDGCDYSQKIPFLWWGLRAGDPGSENGVSGDAVATYDRYLAPHLVALLVRAGWGDRAWDFMQAWGEAGFDFASSVLHVDTILSVGRAILSTAQIVLGANNKKALDQAQQRPISRADAVLMDMERLFKPKTVSYARTPGVIFLDDAQFMTADAALPRFVERLLSRAVWQRWPVLILVTQWKDQLSPPLKPGQRTFNDILGHMREGLPSANGTGARSSVGYLTDKNVVEIALGPIDDLSGALREQLPGLTHTQSAAILEQIGGNPRFLEQVIALLLESEDAFEEFDRSGPLTAEGLEETLRKMKDREIVRVFLSRLRRAPIDVQEAICLASLQGMRFVNGLVDVIGQARVGREVRSSLGKADDPYGILVGTNALREESIGHFAERLFYQVAEQRRRTIRSLGGEAALQTTYKEIVAAFVDNPEYLAGAAIEDRALAYGIAGRLFEGSLLRQERAVAQRALAELGMLEFSRYSFESAVAAYEAVLAIDPGEPSSAEHPSRIDTWNVLGPTYRVLHWPAKSARAFRRIVWEATQSIPDGEDMLSRALDTESARGQFERWQQLHSDWPADRYIWVARTIVNALLNLSELARAIPDLKIDEGDAPFDDTPFLLRSERKSVDAAGGEKEAPLAHLVQARSLQEHAYALNGVLGEGEVQREHVRILLDLSRRAAVDEDDFQAAQRSLERALQITEDLGDLLRQIAALTDFGMVLSSQGATTQSDSYLERALDLIEGILNEAPVLVDVSMDEEEAGGTAHPRTMHSIAVPARFVAESGGDPLAAMNKTWELKRLGANAHAINARNALRNGQHEAARDGFILALNMHEDLGDIEDMTTDLTSLGWIEHKEGHLVSACSYWGRCVDLYLELEQQAAGGLAAGLWAQKREEIATGMRTLGCDGDQLVVR